jgi:uncharacterized protein YacL
MPKPNLVDTSALAHPAFLIAIRVRLITCRQFTIRKSVALEILELNTLPLDAKQAARRRALQALLWLNTLPRLTVVFDRSEPLAKHPDHDLLAWAAKTRGRLITADSELTEKAEAKKLEVVSVLDIASWLRAVSAEILAYFPPYVLVERGQTLSLDVTRRGKSANQGVGYLADGRKVVVNDGASYIGHHSEVIVQHVLVKVEGSEIIFASPKGWPYAPWVQGDDGNEPRESTPGARREKGLARMRRREARVHPEC